MFIDDEVRRRRNEESVGSEKNERVVARGALFGVPHSPSVRHCGVSQPLHSTLRLRRHLLPGILIRRSHSHHRQPRHSRRRLARMLPRALRHRSNHGPRHLQPVAYRTRAALQVGNRRGGGGGRICGGPALALLRRFDG